jgi:hypothetical protein
MRGIAEKLRIFPFFRRNKEGNEIFELREGMVLKLKINKRKSFGKNFFEPDPSSVAIIINVIYESNEVKYCKTTDSSSSKDTADGLHPASFLEANFQSVSEKNNQPASSSNIRK